MTTRKTRETCTCTFSATFEDLALVTVQKLQKGTELIYTAGNGCQIRIFSDGTAILSRETEANRRHIGDGFVGLRKNSSDSMSAQLSHKEEPVHLWNLEHKRTDKILLVETCRSILPSVCLKLV